MLVVQNVQCLSCVWQRRVVCCLELVDAEKTIRSHLAEMGWRKINVKLNFVSCVDSEQSFRTHEQILKDIRS